MKKWKEASAFMQQIQPLVEGVYITLGKHGGRFWIESVVVPLFILVLMVVIVQHRFLHGAPFSAPIRRGTVRSHCVVRVRVHVVVLWSGCPAGQGQVVTSAIHCVGRGRCCDSPTQRFLMESGFGPIAKEGMVKYIVTIRLCLLRLVVIITG